MIPLQYRSQLLARAIIDSIGELGEPTREAILRHFSGTNVSLEPEDLYMDQVARELRNLFGSGAEVLMRNVIRHYKTRAMLDTTSKDIKQLAPLEKIQGVMRVDG